jgi:hypothetical protein
MNCRTWRLYWAKAVTEGMLSKPANRRALSTAHLSLAQGALFDGYELLFARQGLADSVEAGPGG